MQDFIAHTTFDLEAFATFGKLVRGDNRRTNRARGVEILAGRPLVRLALVVANRAIVEDRVCKDMAKSLAFGNVPTALADDDHQFGFIIQLLGARRAYHRLARGHQRTRAAHEQRRIGRHVVAAFLDVIDIVQTKADRLAWACNR